MNRFIRALTALILLLGHAPVASAAPATIHTFSGNDPDDRFGCSVSGIGDVNADGYGDVIVGAYYDDDNGSNFGSARVLSGIDGAILYTVYGDSSDSFFGRSVGRAGDVNGDGRPDVIVGAYYDDNAGDKSGSASVYSGMDGAVLHTFSGDDAGDNFGVSVGGAGDLNGDGRDDVIVGAYLDDDSGSNAGSARVFSGADGSVLYSFHGDDDYDNFGCAVDNVGDFNGDGTADLVVGALGDDNYGNSSGSARVFSGADGSVLYTFDGDSESDVFGTSVSGAGDVNGDGRPDLIVGARGDNNNYGSARVFSGLDGSVLYAFHGNTMQEGFGISVSGAGDVNADGYDDLIVGAEYDDDAGNNAGSARVISGADGATLHTFYGSGAHDSFGKSVSGAGDVNGDGFDDFVVGAPYNDDNGLNSGSARVLTVNGVYQWQGATVSPSDLNNWRLLNTTAMPESMPTGADVMQIGPAPNAMEFAGIVGISRLELLAGGVLRADGAIEGNVVNAGTLHPGNSPGTLRVFGYLEQQSSGQILIELAGGQKGTQYDTIHVTGTALLAGELGVTLVGGFSPSNGQTFDVLSASGGITDSGLVLNAGPGFSMDVVDDGGTDILRLTYQLGANVPEPSSALLALAGLTWALGFRRPRRK